MKVQVWLFSLNFSQLASDVTWSLPVKKVSALLELETKFQTTVGFILYSCSI